MPDDSPHGTVIRQSAGHQQGDDDNFGRANYTQALVAEIRLLIRAVANDPSKRLSEMKVRWKGKDDTEAKDRTFDDVVELLAELDESSDARKDIKKIGLLQAIKDSVISLTTPATGLSIAYTALIVGDQRGTRSDSTFELARIAYGSLEKRANSHRFLIKALAALALLMAMFAAWEATKAALGKNLLQSVDRLHTQQGVLSDNKTKEELIVIDISKLPTHATNKPVIDPNMLPLCERSAYLPQILGLDTAQTSDDTHKGEAAAKPPLDLTPRERELCGQDLILRTNFKLVHFSLRQFNYFWPDMVGGPYSMAAHALIWVESWFDRGIIERHNAGRPKLGTCFMDENASGPNSCQDVEYISGPIVQVISSYTLPLVFGILGSLLYVILSHYTNMKANTLHPRDLPLTYLRGILGVVVAACVSLLITSYAGPGAPAPGSPVAASPNIVASLTLSASAITFLAGFGAEAVFTLLQALVSRVFAMPR